MAPGVVLMTRRESIAALAAGLASAASRLPVNRNVKWGLGSNLWNYFPRVPFTEILDVMKDTGFIGLRLTQFPQILKTYDITAAEMQREAAKRGCQIVTISFNGPTQNPAQRAEVVADAKAAMNFLKEFGANHLVVFPPNRKYLTGEASFQRCARASTKSARRRARWGFTPASTITWRRWFRIPTRLTVAWP